MRQLILGDSLEVLLDHRGKTPRKMGVDFTDDGVPVASAIMVNDGVLDLRAARCVTAETHRRWMAEPTRRGDVLLTSEAPLGRVARVLSDDPLVLGQRLFGLRGLPGLLHNGYLFYALQTEHVRADLIGRSTGTTVSGIRQSALRDVLIPAPDFAEQAAIAEVLGALDDKIAANSRKGELALEVADNIYRQRSAGWSKLPLSDVLVSVLGGTPSRSEAAFWGTGVPWASAKDVAAAPQGVIVETAESITREATQVTKARPLPAGTIILTARGTVGAVARLGTAASFNQSCYAFEPGPLPAGVLYFAIKGVARQARALAHGSVFDTITRITFKHTLVPAPDAPGVKDVELRLKPLLDISQASVQENLALDATRDELLPLLMSGKVRVKDAEKIAEEAL